jgi:hypothetical protein
MGLVLEKNLEKYTVKYSQITPHEALKTKLPKFLKLRNFFPPYLRTQNYFPKPHKSQIGGNRHLRPS